MALIPGTQLGPYTILTPIGKGGMGEVYRARDTRLEREVAIKVLPEYLAKDPQALKRFEREAKALASLSHPGILTIHDVGSADNISFVVMELLEGETLRQRMKRTNISRDQALRIAGSVADSLGAAHSKGVVHRDIKPENIFVTSEDHTKILDFGLARITPKVSPADESSVETASGFKTENGVVMGTVPYMSPEQVRGLDVDTRSDIFSFGCVLYEMIIGNHPFSRPTAADTLAAILKEDPPEFTEKTPGGPEGLVRIISRCLEKNPEKRFQTASDLAFALRSVSREEPATATPLRQARFFPRHRITLLFAVGTLLLVVVTALLYQKTNGDKTIDSIAVMPFENASGDSDTEYLSDGITESLINNLSQIPELRVIARSTVFTYKGKAINPRLVGRELKVGAILMGKVVQRKDALVIQSDLIETDNGSQVWGKQYNRRIADIFAIQEDISTEITDNLRFQLTGAQKLLLTKRPTQNTEAYQTYLRGLFYYNKFSEQDLRKAIGLFEHAIDIDPAFAGAYAGLAGCYSKLGLNFLRPQDSFPESMAAVSKALEIDPDLDEGHVIQGGNLLFYEWDWEGSEKEFKRALELNDKNAEAHQLYSYSLEVAGRYEEAIQEMKFTVEMDPLNLVANADLAWAHFIARRYDAAIEQYRSTAELFSESPMPYVGLAISYAKNGMHREAITEARKSVKGPFIPQIWGMAGFALADSGDTGEAQKLLEQLLETSHRFYIPPLFISGIYIGLGEKDAAFDWLEKAYQDRSGHLVFLKVNPLFDGLRSDPRFDHLLHRMNFPN